MTREARGALDPAGGIDGSASRSRARRPDPTTSIGRLDDLLRSAADPSVRDHWERYLKGTARFRGVPMAGVRRAVRTVVAEEGIAEWPVAAGLRLAHALFAAPMSEDKLAAVLLIAEHLAPRLRLEDAAALRDPLARGHIADWNVTDWYAVKALHAFLVADPGELEARASTVAGWSRGDRLWERRAAVVAFVPLASRPDEPFPGFVDLVLGACADNLRSAERFAQTGPGWVLRELSRGHADQVRTFVETHPELSPEARRMALARLRPGPYRRR